MSIKQNKKGFSMIECLVVIVIISSISIVSISSFKSLSAKTRQASKIDDVTKLQYSFCEGINSITNLTIVSKNGKIYILSYHILAFTPSSVSDDADDINYDIVCNYFLAGIFNKVSGFENGTFDYKPAEFTTSGEKAKNDITYKSSKGVVTIHCEIKNAFAGSYDKLWIKGFTYTSNDGTICNVKL